MLQWHGTSCLPSMIFLHWKGASLVVLAWSSIKSVSLTVSHSRSGSGIFLHCCWRRCMPCSVICDAGVIHPSQSTWRNAVVLVRKKDSTLHFSVDFCRLNMHTKKDSYPLLWIQEALESMVGTTHFSMMDIKSGSWQVKMVPESQQYITFTMGKLGFYKFIHMPFGLCNAPMTFQCLMQNTLGKLNLMYCIIYLDDMIVFGHLEEEHLEHLLVVFESFREFNLKLKPSKCSFFQSEIVYLAHHISREGICPSRYNVCAIEDFPMLETFTKVCAFCGLVPALGKEVKMGLVQLTPEVQEVVRILKGRI